MRSRKAFLYVPGSDLHKIEKAARLGADCVVLDLEDGVAEASKSEARQTIAAALREIDFGTSERVVRVNGFPSGRCEDDLAAVLPAVPDTILLPKVDRAEQISRVDEVMLRAEKTGKRPEGSTALLAIVESALGMVNLEAICRQSEVTARLQGLVFGAEDFTADMGAARTPQALELLYARSRLVMYAAAFGLQAIDLVTVNYKDMEVLEREALQGAQLGYSGKQLIHPLQVEPVQRIFTPSEKEVAAAAHILEEAKRFAEMGKGAFTVDGQMVDRPVIKRAESILARASQGKG
jgi:citrate lyase subunit beta-like protein